MISSHQAYKGRAIFVDIACFLLVFTFVYAAASKLLEWDKFETQIARSPIITRFSSVLTWAVPGIEILICILMFIRSTKLFALYASFTLMVAFTIYIIGILCFSEHIPCSCGGILENMSWRHHLLFNILLTIITASAVLLYPPKKLLRNNRDLPKTL